MDPNVIPNIDLWGQIKIVWTFVTAWAFLPASAVIYLIVAGLKKTKMDIGEANVIYPFILAMIFAFVQKPIALGIHADPVQTETIPILVMGVCTGAVPVVMHRVKKAAPKLLEKAGELAGKMRRKK